MFDSDEYLRPSSFVLHHLQEAPTNGNGSSVDPLPTPVASLPNKADATEGSQLNATENLESLGCKVSLRSVNPCDSRNPVDQAIFLYFFNIF